MATILFDWDGTIVDSMGMLFEADAAICREIGLPFDLAIYRRAFSPNWRLKYKALGIPEARVPEAVGIWQRLFRDEEHGPFEGVIDALRRLSDAGHTLGIVTAGDRNEIEPQLVRLGIDDLVGVRVYGEDTSNGKPDPEPLRLALTLSGATDPNDAIYLGDALDDMRMAVAVGALGVGIVSMLATEAELRECGASETAASVAEWVDGFLRRQESESPVESVPSR
jgi:pyrophosphatase PpaX